MTPLEVIPPVAVDVYGKSFDDIEIILKELEIDSRSDVEILSPEN